MGISSNNPVTQALVVYITMAIFMICVGLGIMNIISTRTIPISYAILLLIFAILFIVGSVFFENKGAEHVGSLIGGGIVALIVTFAIVAFISGLYAAVHGEINKIGWEGIITGLAMGMIASLVIIKLVQHNKWA